MRSFILTTSLVLTVLVAGCQTYPEALPKTVIWHQVADPDAEYRKKLILKPVSGTVKGFARLPKEGELCEIWTKPPQYPGDQASTIFHENKHCQERKFH